MYGPSGIVRGPVELDPEPDYVYATSPDYFFHELRAKPLYTRSPEIIFPGAKIELDSEGKSYVVWSQVSPSQIENFSKCKRAWFFKSILRVPEEQKQHQALGESMHLVLEKVPQNLPYAHSDTIADPKQWATAEALAQIVLPLLPVSDQIDRELGIRMSTFEGGPGMLGYIDIVVPPGIGWPSFLIPPSDPIVGDYKTLSDFRYMKSPAELADSVQMMTYAKWLTDKLTELGVGHDSVRLLHVYAKTRAPFNRNSVRHESAIVSIDEINTKWNSTLDTIREMQQTAIGCSNHDEVEASGALTGHCEAYGGCAFRAKCGIGETTIKSLFQITKKETPVAGASIIDKIREAREKAGLAQGAPTSGAPVVGVVVPASGSAIIPPDAPPREQAVITRPGEPPPVVSTPAPAPVVEDEDEEAETVLATATVPPKPKRGRPSREEMAAREAAEKEAFEARVMAEVAKRGGDGDNVKLTSKIVDLNAQIERLKNENATLRERPAGSPEGLTLYVDCFPVKGDREHVDFFEWIAPLTRAVAEMNEVGDYRLIQYTSKGLLATAMRELIKAEGLPKSMTVGAMAPGADVALEILTPLAKRVIRKL